MILKCENLTYIYSQGTPFVKKALDDVNLEIDEGDFVGIIGHTGSGKSTLIQHLNGLLKPTEGKIYIDGVDITASAKAAHDARFKVGLVFQYPEYQLFEETVYKDIAFGPKNMGLTEEEIHGRIYEAIKFVGLEEEYLEKSPFELSGGQKRRVAIAGVIAMKPSILILDEPTAGLDPKGRDDILDHIKMYQQEENATVLLVSHSMEDVAKYTKKILVMNKSKKVMFDTVENIFKKPDELRSMGLNVPQITKIMTGLHNRGYDVDLSVYTVARAKKEIMKLIAKKKGAGKRND